MLKRTVRSHSQKSTRHLASLTCAYVLGIGLASPGMAEYSVDLGDGNVITFGGYAKVDIRFVNGDIGYQDYWIANAPIATDADGNAVDTSHTGFNVRESRFNIKYAHGDVSAFLEMDFYGGGGNEVVSNSSNPRMRHYFINYKNWLVGQTWSTFMPLSVLPESLDFGGPHVGEVFIRQTQLRYTVGGFQIAIENPETNGDGDVGSPSSAVGLTADQADPDEDTPDLVLRYNFSGDWGDFSIGALLRKVDQGGIDETAVAANIASKINIGRDDLRLQVTVGEPGRYTAAGMTPDVVDDPDTVDTELEVEESISYVVAYRHMWTETLRSSAYYGATETDVLGRDRAHWAVNIIGDIAPNLSAGFELGNYSIEDDVSVLGPDGGDADSDYAQVSFQFTF